jgi:hypothetical protein
MQEKAQLQLVVREGAGTSLGVFDVPVFSMLRCLRQSCGWDSSCDRGPSKLVRAEGTLTTGPEGTHLASSKEV